MPFPKTPIPIRFWQLVDKQDSCWIWIGHRQGRGYGYFRPNQPKGMLAHRMAYILTYGAIPKGKLICHRCDVKLCVNPKHLFCGTQKQNSIDMVLKKRASKQFNQPHEPYVDKHRNLPLELVNNGRQRGFTYKKQEVLHGSDV